MNLEGPWSPTETGPKVRVVLLNFKGETRHSWEADVDRLEDKLVVLKAVANKELSFEEVEIHQGDLLVQYLPRNEWFYIQEYLTPSRQIKGWYCNIATPPKVEQTTITTQDLIVDIFVWPDGRYKVLDMDELEKNKGQLEGNVVEKIFQAKRKLVQMIEKGDSPFHFA